MPVQDSGAYLQPTQAPGSARSSLLEAVQVEVAQVLHVEGSRLDGRFVPRTAMIGDASGGQGRAIQPSALQFPAHMEFETGRLLRVLVATARPLLVQGARQAKHAAIFQNHRPKAPQQFHGHRLGCLDHHCAQLFQQPTQELGTAGGETLVDGGISDRNGCRFGQRGHLF